MKTKTTTQTIKPKSILFHSLYPDRLHGLRQVVKLEQWEWNRQYCKVAIVHTACPKHVFRVTQICNELTDAEMEIVDWIRPRCRSTMAGDIAVGEFGIYCF